MITELHKPGHVASCNCGIDVQDKCDMQLRENWSFKVAVQRMQKDLLAALYGGSEQI